jgi:transcriptional regulator GlxA family with amidase domain
MIRAQVVLLDRFDPLDAVALHEMLCAGGTVSGGALTVQLVSPDGPGPVAAGSGGFFLRATGALDPARGDLVVIPGAAVPGIDVPAQVLRALDAPHVTVAAVGDGSLLLAMAGLIQHRRVAAHHRSADLLVASGAVPVRARVVDDGDLVTASGLAAGLDLGLYLLERELGARVAHGVEEVFGYERRGTVWRREGVEPVLPPGT